MCVVSSLHIYIDVYVFSGKLIDVQHGFTVYARQFLHVYVLFLVDLHSTVAESYYKSYSRY